MEFFSIIVISMISGFVSVFSGFGVSLAMLPLLLLLINSFFRLVLFKALINRHILLFFGVPAAIMSFVGARALVLISQTNVPISYNLFSLHFSTSTLKLIIGLLIISFVMLEFAHRFKMFSPHKLATTISGLISGFIGGISGYQGGFQAAILLKLNMPLRQYITTYAAITITIDLPRILVYFSFMDHAFADSTKIWPLTFAATLSTMLGTYMAYRYTKKITTDIIHLCIITLSFLMGIGLVMGKV